MSQWDTTPRNTAIRDKTEFIQNLLVHFPEKLNQIHFRFSDILMNGAVYYSVKNSNVSKFLTCHTDNCPVYQVILGGENEAVILVVLQGSGIVTTCLTMK